MTRSEVVTRAFIGAAVLLLACAGREDAPKKAWVGSRVVAEDGVAGDGFGHAVAVSADGRVLVVGAPRWGVSGSVYVYEWDEASGGYTFTSQLFDGTILGQSVAVSSDGATLVFGDYGLAHLWRWDAAIGDWIETEVKDPAPAPAGGQATWFGDSVAVTRDGATVAVASSSGTTAVYARTGTGWSSATALYEGANETEDTAISSDGDTIIQARGWEGAALFRKAQTGWTESFLYPSDLPAVSDNLSWSVATFSGGDGLVLGSYGPQGAAYVYRWDGARWGEEKLGSPSPGPNDDFGITVGAAEDGETIAVAAPDSDTVYVYRRNGTSWAVDEVKPTDGASGTYFGGRLAVSADGRTLVVGADATGPGVVYVYRRQP